MENNFKKILQQRNADIHPMIQAISPHPLLCDNKNMIRILSEAEIPKIYTVGIGMSNFPSGAVYAEVKEMSRPIPGTQLDSLSDYLDCFSQSDPDISLPPVPQGVVSLKTLEENRLFRIIYNTQMLSKAEVEQFAKTLPL